MIIPNYSLGGQKWNDSIVLQIGNNTDGILTESGFTGGGGGSSATNTTHGPHYSGTEWVQRVEFSRNLQRHGKAYFTNISLFSLFIWPAHAVLHILFPLGLFGSGITIPLFTNPTAVGHCNTRTISQLRRTINANYTLRSILASVLS